MFRVLGWLVWAALELSLVLLLFGTPLVGFWLASSLAAHLDGPRWLPLAAGLLVFPILPVLWEVRAHRRFVASGRGERFTSLFERLAMRTFAIGLLFAGSLLAWWPRQSFVALSTRGDWMLQGRSGTWVEPARKGLFRAADLLEVLYRATGRNPYEELVEKRPDPPRPPRPGRRVEIRRPDPRPDPTPVPTGRPDPEPDPTPGAAPEPDPTPDPAPPPPQGASPWPWSPTGPDPRVAAFPPSAETDPAGVARALVAGESDEFQRLKLLHDWVADRIAYDVVSLQPGRRAPQDALTVFRTRLGVCAGYANLLAAMGEAVGMEIPVVVGDAMPEAFESGLTGPGHAWNAARIRGEWYLIDVTWDSGYLDAGRFVKRYQTAYLAPPPRAMARDHFPKDPAWQLLETPLSQGEFLRQPRLKPGFTAHGLELLTPTRSTTESGAEAVLEIDNPRGRWIMVGLEHEGRKVGENSKPVRDPRVRIARPLPGAGTYRAKIYVSPERSATYWAEGEVAFVRGA